MSEIHSGPVHAPDVDGQCTWRFDGFGQHLRCDERAIPGGPECADHLVARFHPEPDAVLAAPPAPEPGPWRRWFTEEPA